MDMQAEKVIKKLSEKIGELETNNIILQMQIEELTELVNELEEKANEHKTD